MKKRLGFDLISSLSMALIPSKYSLIWKSLISINIFRHSQFSRQWIEFTKHENNPYAENRKFSYLIALTSVTWTVGNMNRIDGTTVHRIKLGTRASVPTKYRTLSKSWEEEWSQSQTNPNHSKHRHHRTNVARVTGQEGEARKKIRGSMLMRRRRLISTSDWSLCILARGQGESNREETAVSACAVMVSVPDRLHLFAH